MGLASHPSPNPRQADAPRGVGIVDTIEMKESHRIAHAPGLVVILDSYPSADPQAFIGRGVHLRTPAGHVLAVRVEAVRNHLATISFFFRDLSKADVPAGSRVEFED